VGRFPRHSTTFSMQAARKIGNCRTANLKSTGQRIQVEQRRRNPRKAADKDHRHVGVSSGFNVASLRSHEVRRALQIVQNIVKQHPARHLTSGRRFSLPASTGKRCVDAIRTNRRPRIDCGTAQRARDPGRRNLKFRPTFPRTNRKNLRGHLVSTVAAGITLASQLAGADRPSRQVSEGADSRIRFLKLIDRPRVQ
jgi:hypothetical protein